MPVATSRSCCMRLTCTLFKIQWRSLTKCIFFFLIAVSLLSLGLADRFSRWGQLSIEAAAASAFLCSAASLLQVLKPILYRELTCLRWIARRLRITSARRESEDQIPVLKLIGHLPQLVPVTDKGEELMVREIVGFQTARDNVLYLTDYPVKQPHFRNAKNADQEALVAKASTGYSVPQDDVIFLEHPPGNNHIISNIGLYKVAVTRKYCLRAFLVLLNATDHYVIDELNTVYQANGVWLPPGLLKERLLLYGEITVETQRGPNELVFKIIRALRPHTAGHQDEAISQQIIKDIIKAKRVKEEQTCVWERAQGSRAKSCMCSGKTVSYYNEFEPFSLRQAVFTPDTEVLTESLVLKFKEQQEDSKSVGGPIAGLIFMTKDGAVIPHGLPLFSVWAVKDGQFGRVLSEFFPRDTQTSVAANIDETSKDVIYPDVSQSLNQVNIVHTSSS